MDLRPIFLKLHDKALVETTLLLDKRSRQGGLSVEDARELSTIGAIAAGIEAFLDDHPRRTPPALDEADECQS